MRDRGALRRHAAVGDDHAGPPALGQPAYQRAAEVAAAHFRKSDTFVSKEKNMIML
jgi:hypothetical protein